MAGSYSEHIPPEENDAAYEALHLVDWGDEIIRQLGSPRDGEGNTYEAYWDADNGQRMELQAREDKKQGKRYMLRIFEPFEYYAGTYLRYTMKSHKTTLCDADWNMIDTPKTAQQLEADMTAYLRTSPICPNITYTVQSTEKNFWELACVYALTESHIQKRVDDILSSRNQRVSFFKERRLRREVGLARVVLPRIVTNGQKEQGVSETLGIRDRTDTRKKVLDIARELRLNAPAPDS